MTGFVGPGRWLFPAHPGRATPFRPPGTPRALLLTTGGSRGRCASAPRTDHRRVGLAAARFLPRYGLELLLPPRRRARPASRTARQPGEEGLHELPRPGALPPSRPRDP